MDCAECDLRNLRSFFKHDFLTSFLNGERWKFVSVFFPNRKAYEKNIF